MNANGNSVPNIKTDPYKQCRQTHMLFQMGVVLQLDNKKFQTLGAGELLCVRVVVTEYMPPQRILFQESSIALVAVIVFFIEVHFQVASHFASILHHPLTAQVALQ